MDLIFLLALSVLIEEQQLVYKLDVHIYLVAKIFELFIFKRVELLDYPLSLEFAVFPFFVSCPVLRLRTLLHQGHSLVVLLVPIVHLPLLHLMRVHDLLLLLQLVFALPLLGLCHFNWGDLNRLRLLGPLPSNSDDIVISRIFI